MRIGLFRLSSLVTSFRQIRLCSALKTEIDTMCTVQPSLPIKLSSRQAAVNKVRRSKLRIAKDEINTLKKEVKEMEREAENERWDKYYRTYLAFMFFMLYCSENSRRKEAKQSYRRY